MQARIMRATGGACPCAGARTAARARCARACASVHAAPTHIQWNAQGVCAYAEGSLLIHRFCHSCDGTVVCAVSPRGRRDKWRRLRRGCGAHRPDAAGRDCARDCCCGSNGRFVVAVWCCRSMVSVSAPIRMRCRPTRAVADAVFVSHLFAVFAVYSAHSFHHLRKRLNVALACASFFLLVSWL